jgi:hypothetical protein
MTSSFDTSPFVLAAVLFGALGAIFVVAGIAALVRFKPLRFTIRTLVGLLLVSIGSLAGAIGLGMAGYRALTYEEVAARVSVRPIGPQRFEATVRIPDRPEITHELSGDQIYVDAHILKWKPMANVLGLHTAYELDRLSGRYVNIEKERSADRTIHSLAPERLVDLFELRQRYAFLAPLLDAEYGSGTFVPVTKPADLEVRVSTTGLLIREVPRRK